MDLRGLKDALGDNMFWDGNDDVFMADRSKTEIVSSASCLLLPLNNI